MENIFLIFFLLTPFLTFIALIKPFSIFRGFSKKQILLSGIILFITSFVGFGMTSEGNTIQENTNNSTIALLTLTPTSATEPKEETTTLKIPESLSLTEIEKKTGSVTLVTSVTDGDTIKIEGGQAVRYIGIDTPETVHPSKPVQCYGKEASEKNKSLVLNKEVFLERDVSETDKYGRLLRYVWIGDMLLNEYLVREGYAMSSSYPPDIKYQNRFIEAQRLAREEKKGLWGSVCDNWDTATPTSTVNTANTSSGNCLFDCNGVDKDCGDFSSHQEAQEFFECCGFTADYDPMKLDSVGVGNGIACESI